MTNLQRYCHTCTHWEWDENIYLADGTVAYPGHCGLFSARCINAVADGNVPPDYQSLEGMYEEDLSRL